MDAKSGQLKMKVRVKFSMRQVIHESAYGRTRNAFEVRFMAQFRLYLTLNLELYIKVHFRIYIKVHKKVHLRLY